jgi:hypothetical protein
LLGGSPPKINVSFSLSLFFFKINISQATHCRVD